MNTMKNKGLDLSDFNVENEGIIESQGKEVKQRNHNEKKVATLTKKMQVGLTEDEYSKLYEEFEQSGFPSFAGYIRMKLKNIDFI